MNKDADYLKIIADHPELMRAVKEVILKQFDLSTLGINYDNETLGQFTRSRLEGREKLEIAFKEISNYKSVIPKPEGKNPAR